MELVNKVLFVDDDNLYLKSLYRAFQEQFEVFVANNVVDAMSTLESEGPFAVVVSDYRMPGYDGLQFLRFAKQCAPQSARILLTGYPDMDLALAGINDIKIDALVVKASSLDILETVIRNAVINYNAALRANDLWKSNIMKINKQLEDIQTLTGQYHKELADSREGIYKVLPIILSAKAPGLFIHSTRVAALAEMLSQLLGLPEEKIMQIKNAALIHDFGMIYLPDEIVNTNDSLTLKEESIESFHVKFGYDLLARMPLDQAVLDIVYQHHERLDGSGYPQGLFGKDIPVESQIIAIADVMETMSRELDIYAALNYINVNRDIKFSRAITDICTSIFQNDKFNFENINVVEYTEAQPSLLTP
ncbi:MAG: HD domain-containing phosphohydrolase [Negativicutes bacterium]|nr:HD domain-containing phosphohydrolase [Negativicutes bacterium]